MEILHDMKGSKLQVTLIKCLLAHQINLFNNISDYFSAVTTLLLPSRTAVWIQKTESKFGVNYRRIISETDTVNFLNIRTPKILL